MQPTNELIKDVSTRQVVTTRILKAPREAVFEAWSNPALLAQWWGPKGFTNTFEEFDLRPGGTWKFIMHGPNGKDYPNQSEFVEIRPPERIVLNHLSAPAFQVTATFEEVEEGTLLNFCMLFPTEDLCKKVGVVAIDANEENFDRLEALLKKDRI